jgi:hypothetical protein
METAFGEEIKIKNLIVDLSIVIPTWLLRAADNLGYSNRDLPAL